jgi:hypothetical protein
MANGVKIAAIDRQLFGHAFNQKDGLAGMLPRRRVFADDSASDRATKSSVAGEILDRHVSPPGDTAAGNTGPRWMRSRELRSPLGLSQPEG